MSSSIGKNIFFVYITNIIAAGSTFGFWVIASNLTNSEIIGKVAAVGSLCMILGVLSNFDLGVGMKRFLGKAAAEKDWPRFKQVSSISTLFGFSMSIGILLIVLNPVIDILGMIGIEKQFIPVIIIIVLGNDLQSMFMGTLISSMRSKSIILPNLVGTLSRFPLLFLLLFMVEKSELNVAFAYSSFYLVLSFLLFAVTSRFYKKIPGSYFYNAKNNLKLVIYGSLPRWIPQIITTLGSQISILIIFTVKGPSESGLFYIPFGIYLVLSLISGAMNQVSHPVFSGIESGESRKEFLRKTLKLTFLGSMPLAGIVFFYSKEILSLFGPEFVASTNILEILILSFPAMILAEGVYYLLYARGHYKNVLFLGLLGNIPRIILYIILVPIYGGMGGAIAFVIGAFLQLILTIILIEKMNIRLQYLLFAFITIIPFALGYSLQILNAGIFGAIILFFASFALYIKFRMLDEDDLQSMLKLFLPNEKALKAKRQISILLKKFRLL